MRPSTFGLVFSTIATMGIVCAGTASRAAPIFNNYTSPKSVAVDNVALAAAQVPESPTIALIGAGIVILIARPNGRRARGKSIG